jgi:hypothetical protein
MYSTLGVKVLVICLFFVHPVYLLAQPELTIYTDWGTNNVSHGLFIKSAAIGHYKFGKNMVETGLQLDLKYRNKNVFSGYTINASRSFMIKSIPLELKGFFLFNPFSDILRETNWGFLLKSRIKHFDLVIGTNFRTYAYRKRAIIDYGIEKDASKIHEAFNLMYSFSYYLKPTDDQWNVGLSVTNIDYFIINQETNPILSLRGLYKLKSPLSFFAQAWYEPAGALNLNTNYFGFFIRTGIIWDIN